MKKLFSLLIFFVAFSVNAQIITNVDKLRINEITEIQASGKILVVDSDNVVQWISEDKITPDLSDYYTKIDVDAILEDYYDKGEVDLLLSNIDLSDYYTKSEVDSLLSNLPTGTPNLADVLSEGNSADNNRITDLADGVDAGDAVNKSQLDALESPFEVIDVTQHVYSDIAINVKGFGNTQAGVTYQEGSIDFGVNRVNVSEMGLFSFRSGIDNESSGGASVAFGEGTSANNMYSFSSGAYTTASGEASFSSGVGTTASDEASFASGYNTTASGGSSFSSGYNTTASGVASFASGVGTIANEYASLAIGRNTTNGTPETSWVNGSPIFKVGNGISTNNRKNAYTLYNDGRSEQEKDMEVTTIGQGFVLKSPDGTRWRITVDNNGDLSAEQL